MDQAEIYERITRGLTKQTRLAGERKTVLSVGKDFEDKAKDGLDKFAHTVVKGRNKKNIEKLQTNKETNNLDQYSDFDGPSL